MGLVATLCCLLWGSAYPVIKLGYVAFAIAPEDIPSKYVFAGYRFVLAGLLLLLIAKLNGSRFSALSARSWAGLTGLGILQTGVQYLFFYVGVANTTGVKGAIMNATTTFFSVGLAHYFYRNDKLNRYKIIGCLLGFAGVVIVNFQSGLLAFSFRWTGEGFVILAALTFSIAALWVKRITQTVDVLLTTGFSLLIGGAALALLGLGFGGRVVAFTWTSAGILLYLVILSSVAFCLWNLLLKYNKVGQISIYNFLIPVFGTLLSGLLLGEQVLEMKNLAALILVSLGIRLVYWKTAEQKRSLG